jgi:undecaprenyl-diphosphatase
VGLVFAVALVKIAGSLHYDPRPFVAHHFTPLVAQSGDNGFPSDHTTFTMLAAFVLLPYARRWGYVLIGLAFIVGLGRIGAGVHSPQDILGGITVAALAAAGAYYIARWLIKPKKLPAPKA